MLLECVANHCVPPESDLCFVPPLTLNDVAFPPQVALLFSAKFIWNPTAWSLHRSKKQDRTFCLRRTVDWGYAHVHDSF